MRRSAVHCCQGKFGRSPAARLDGRARSASVECCEASRGTVSIAASKTSPKCLRAAPLPRPRYGAAPANVPAKWRASRNPAGHDQIEITQIGRHIVGKSVRGDPAAQMHAERGQLLSPGRSSRPKRPAALDAGCATPKSADGRESSLLQAAPRTSGRPTVFAEIQNRIADHLAGAVVGDVAAAVGGVKLHVHLLQAVRPRALKCSRLPLRPSVITWGCSHRQQHIRHVRPFARRDGTALQIPGLGRRVPGPDRRPSKFLGRSFHNALVQKQLDSVAPTRTSVSREAR